MAPRDSSVLLNMNEMADDVLKKTPGTIMVHCSGGVGRTGAFLGLYKLIKDFKHRASNVIIMVKDCTMTMILCNQLKVIVLILEVLTEFVLKYILPGLSN